MNLKIYSKERKHFWIGSCLSVELTQSAQCCTLLSSPLETNNSVMYSSWGSTSTITTGYGPDNYGSEVLSPSMGKVSLFSRTSRPVVGPIQVPMQWAVGDLYPGILQLSPEADHSPTTSAEAKYACTHICTSSHASRQSVYLVRNRDNISFLNMETTKMCIEIIPKQWKNILSKEGNQIYH